ncbi:MAG TPA: NF038122 family metalloprotease [Verrucomicrobiae bacterium]
MIVALILSGFPLRANLVIVPTWDSTITSDPNASSITNTILQVITLYQASFSDNVTVSITFAEMSTGLGQSQTFYATGLSYSSIRSKLVASATTADDKLALAHLPNASTNPVNGSSTMELTLPNGRALGFSGAGWTGSPDGTVWLNTSIMNLTRTSINPSKYDLYAVAAHEINEVLGLSSSLDGLANGAAAPTGDIDSLDLFRYDQNGNRSFNTGSASQAYFSLDGMNRLVRYNQDASGDFHDWYSPGGQTPRVQDAFATAGATPNPTVEMIALDVIGYHFMVPAIAMSKVAANRESLSWSPVTPGFYVVESTNLLSTNWVATLNGTNNPVTVTNTVARKFYRMFHP